MDNNKFDVIVIGAGPGGYVAAIKAAQQKLKVAIIEEKHLGGICLNWGCIPTKALLKSSEVKAMIDHSSDYGITTKGTKIDFAAIIKRSRGIAQQLSSGIAHLIKKNNITLFMGRATIKATGSNHQIEITDDKKKTTVISAKNIILATGARAKQIPGMECDAKRIWDYKQALAPTIEPKSLLVVGSGAIGLEFASFYATLGTKVTVVELQDRIMPVEDPEISTLAHKSFTDRGIEIYTNSSVTSLKNNGKEVNAVIKKDQKTDEKRSFDCVLMAIGISANIENIGLENTKIKTEKGHIVVNDMCLTNEPGIYAIGDVAGAPWLAHKASHEGIIAVEHICGHKIKGMSRTNIPGCTYTSPQVASVGLTEPQAIETHGKDDIKIGRFPFMANGKALAIGKPDGLVKTIFHAKTGELLGAHMVGSDVTELIQGFVIAKTAELTEAEIMHTVFAHPTLSEMLHEATLDAFDQAIHI